MTIDFKVTASDVIIRQVNNGWIVFEVSPDGDEIETNVFEDNDYTAVDGVIKHIFDDYTQTKRRGGFSLDWRRHGWAHQSEDCSIEDCLECIED